jgi:hypothetical protein
MLKVAEKPVDGKAKNNSVAKFHTVSGVRKASLWLDDEVAKTGGGVSTQIIDLTPDLAAALLERNPGNRKIRDNAVEQFARDITEGNWPFNGESIIVANDGALNDGQHRCAAVVLARKSIKVVLVIGAARETRTTLDQGRNRQIADYLAMEGHSDSLVLGSAAYIAWQIDKYGLTTRSRDFRPTKGELMAYIETHSGLGKSCANIPHYGVRKVGGRPVLGYCHWAFSNWSGAADASRFIELLITGEKLERGDPILYIRNRLMDGTKYSVAEKVELIYRGWNAWRRGEKVTRIVVVGGRLPELEV